MAPSKSKSGLRPRKKRGPPKGSGLAARYQKEPQEENQEPGPSGDQSKPASSSAQKITVKNCEVPTERAEWSGHRIIDVDLVFGALCESLACKNCGEDVKITEICLRGQSSIFEMKCTNAECDVRKTFRNCAKVAPKKFEVNTRLAYAGRACGLGISGVKKFCALLDLPPPLATSNHQLLTTAIHDAVKMEAASSMEAAVQEEIELTGSRDIAASGDGTWQKRGFKSRHGVVTLVGAKTGKAIDTEVLSTVCQGCLMYKGPKEGEEYEEWLDNHKEICRKNHNGSSGMMEVEGLKRIFKRSVQHANYRIAKYIGDGGTKSYKSVCDDKPYGDDLVPTKIECTGHVQKRMHTRLESMKTSYKGKKLSDGGTLGGKGRLTLQRIKTLSNYYGNAIRGSPDVATMSTAIWAIWHHYRSTDAKPDHGSCPKGKESWCRYNKAVALRKKSSFRHTNSLGPIIMDAIKPVFVELSKPELLERCVGGFTQNPNECLNSLIWRVAPKGVFVGRETIETAVHDAVLVFNDGQSSRLKVLTKLGVTPGKFLVQWVNKENNRRLRSANQATLAASKEARTARRKAALAEQEEDEPAYQAGAF